MKSYEIKAIYAFILPYALDFRTLPVLMNLKVDDNSAMDTPHLFSMDLKK